MSSEAYYEDENKSYDFETPYSSETEINSASVIANEAVRSNATTVLVATGGSTNYVREDDTSLENSYSFNDYEIVNNDEFDDEQDLQQHLQEQPLRLVKHTALPEDDRKYQLACVELTENRGTGKLRLSLSSEKISLKSQKVKKKINKSIEKSKPKRKRETQPQQQQQQQQQNATKTEALTIDTITQQQQQQQQQQQLRHAPVINFTIAPIGCVRHNKNSTADAIDKRLPEIVLPLTSIRAATAAKQKQCAHATTRATTVTFRAAAATSTAALTATKSVPAASSAAPPIEQLTADVTPSRQITVAEVYSTQDGAAANVADSESDFTLLKYASGRDSGLCSGGVGGCGGSSTSPESLMDNILSAASSVSVRSSSSQQSCTGAAPGDAVLMNLMKIPPLPPPPLPPPPLSVDITQSQKRSRAFCDYAMPRPMRALNPTRIPSMGFASLVEQRQQERDTRDLSTTTTNCNATTITTAWVHQQPMPSVAVAAVATSCTTPMIVIHRRDDYDTLTPHTAMYTEANRISPVSFQNDVSDGEAGRVRSNRSRSTSPLIATHSMSVGTTKNQVDVIKSLQLPVPEPQTPLHFKCAICGELMRDPRTLNCLHSFCMQCLVEENVKADATCIAFWSLSSNGERQLGSSGSAVSALASVPAGNEQENEAKSATNNGTGSCGGGGGGSGGMGCSTTYSKCNGESIRSQSPETSSASCSPSRRTSFNFIRKKSLEKILLKLKPDNNKSDGSKLPPTATNYECAPASGRVTATNACRLIWCKVCNFATEVPVGGLRQLPQNLLLARKIDAFKRQQSQVTGVIASPQLATFASIAHQWCSLCVAETEAVFHCLNCTLYLCTLCKESHERQRTTASHKLQLLPFEARRKLPSEPLDASATKLKCSMHGGYEMKAFCSTCLQVCCADCLVLLHRGHKHESIAKAMANYARTLSELAEQTKPLCAYAEHTIAQLNEIAEHVNSKCDNVQIMLDSFIEEYLDALEVHRKTLRQQLQRARETKLHMLLEQQAELARRTKEASEVVRFSQELALHGSDAELLAFVGVLLKRFEYCQQFEAPDETKICDTLQLLRQVRAPESKRFHGIPLFGIITTQAVAPSLCTLDWGSSGDRLRLSRKIELTLLTRDAHDLPLSHGGLAVQARLRHKSDKDAPSAVLPPAPRVVVSDNRDGTYTLTFTPNATGQLLLNVSVNDKAIKGSPFGFNVSCTRPHTGVYHCCANCSSKGNRQRMRRCACTPNGTSGCSHGQPGHPGARHWSCCGGLKKHSDCSFEPAQLPPPPLPTQPPASLAPPPPPPPSSFKIAASTTTTTTAR